MKQVDQPHDKSLPPVLDLTALPNDLAGGLKFSPVSAQEMPLVAALRAGSDPWRGRGENTGQRLQALAQLQPYVQVSRLQNHVVGYVTVERDGPVAGAAYMRNIVVKTELRRKGIGTLLLNHAIKVAKDLHRKTLALRVDPANSAAGWLYPKAPVTPASQAWSRKA